MTLAETMRSALTEQFGATMAMLRNAIEACPDELWSADDAEMPFWYLAFHTLFWLELYLSPDAQALHAFHPPPPFGLTELEPGDQRPPEAYRKTVLLEYLAHCRERCVQTLARLDADTAAVPAPFSWLAPASTLEVHIYNLRHVQHGAAQLNLMLRRSGVAPPRWVKRTSPTASRLPPG